MNELKYESRLEFGTASDPSITAVWDATRTILINGLPQQPSFMKATPATAIKLVLTYVWRFYNLFSDLK